MIPITTYRISSDYNSADSADENDTRNKRESKRKLVTEPPRMRQAERINTEKMLLDAMQLASQKSNSQSKFEKNVQAAKKDVRDSFHIATDESRFEAKLANEIFQASHANEDKFQEKPQFTNFLSKLMEIESSLSGNQRRTEPTDILAKLKIFATQLYDNESKKAETEKAETEKAETEKAETEKAETDASIFDRNSMKCSIDFIEGYCEASSFNDDVKKEISDELNTIKDMLDQLAALNSPIAIPVLIVEAIAVQTLNESTIKFSESRSSVSRIKSSVLNKDDEKKRGDTLPLATLRSI